MPLHSIDSFVSCNRLLSIVVVPRSCGLFLHSPFPSSEIFRTFPKREELLRSMLNADLIGEAAAAAVTVAVCNTAPLVMHVIRSADVQICRNLLRCM
jgi:hypothetical protein